MRILWENVSPRMCFKRLGSQKNMKLRSWSSRIEFFDLQLTSGIAPEFFGPRTKIWLQNLLTTRIWYLMQLKSGNWLRNAGPGSGLLRNCNSSKENMNLPSGVVFLCLQLIWLQLIHFSVLELKFGSKISQLRSLGISCSSKAGTDRGTPDLAPELQLWKNKGETSLRIVGSWIFGFAVDFGSSSRVFRSSN